jgi:hypothetical protein
MWMVQIARPEWLLSQQEAPAHFVSQAGSLVTRRVLVADATFKRPKDFFLNLLNMRKASVANAHSIGCTTLQL